MKTIIISLKVFLFLTLITGILYPLFVTGMAKTLFRNKSEGSMIINHDSLQGSLLIGQHFGSDRYFHSRPSFVDYNPLPSGASNLGLTSAKLKSSVEQNKKEFILKNDLSATTGLPSEMLFSSASGLDPDISPEAALMQVERVAKARNFDSTRMIQLRKTIADLSCKRQILVLGEPRINVLMLNMKLDKIR